MLLSAGIVALSRKVSDERARKREAKQGLLSVGDSAVAKEAFESGQPLIARSGTTIRFEDANNVGAESSPNTTSPIMNSGNPTIYDTRQTSRVDVTSPVESTKATIALDSSPTDTPSTSSGDFNSQRMSLSHPPPPYSPLASSTAISPSVYSVDSTGIDRADPDLCETVSTTGSTRSTNSSHGASTIRIMTNGSDLKSGFPYRPALFDLRVPPDVWTRFTLQVTESTKLGTGDYAQMLGAAAATALTGFIATSVVVGRSMKRSIQEKKVRTGLQDMSGGGLGETLRHWNDSYFGPRGLFVHLELSASAMKNPDQKSRTFRKHALLYSKREDRERKRDERKFVIVVTKLDDDGMPAQAIREMEAAAAEEDDEDGEEAVGRPVELPTGDIPPTIAEMPGEEARDPVELPAVEVAPGPRTGGRRLELPQGYAELDSETTQVFEKMALEKVGNE